MGRATWCSSCWRVSGETAARARGGRRAAGRRETSASSAITSTPGCRKKLEDIGDLRLGKFILLLGYCLQAIWCRFRYGVQNFYYIPAPGKRSALYRDWVVMLICRPFFKRVILHWHAAGLAKWLEMVVTMRSRSLTYRLMKQVDLSIVLSKYNRADAEKIFSRQVRVVSNGIPDPVPPVCGRRSCRGARRALRRAGSCCPARRLEAADLQDTGGDPQLIRVLYLAHCTREKGLFDTLDGGGARQPAVAQPPGAGFPPPAGDRRLRDGGGQSRV